MTDVPAYTVRLMREEEIPQVLEVWRETELSEGTYSLYTWFQVDPEGFYVAATDEGEILGMCTGVLQHQELAFIGLYAVKSIYQRRGIGTKIWKAVMDHVGDRNAGVNAVPAQLSNYRDRAGFPVQSDWSSHVCNAGIDLYERDLVDKIPKVEVRKLTPNDTLMDDVVRYDLNVNGFSRSKIVSLSVEEGDSVSMVALKSGPGERRTVCGYGIAKKNIKGNALIGPLYADDKEIAELILTHIADEFPVAKEKGMTMMITDRNPEAIKLIEKLGFKKNPGVARLYRTEEVSAGFDKIFSQHNLNFAVF